jgi:hypothetical protein
MGTPEYWRLTCGDEPLIGVVCDNPEVFSQKEFEDYKKYIDENVGKFECIIAFNNSLKALLKDDAIPTKLQMDEQMNAMQIAGFAGEKIPIDFCDFNGNITTAYNKPTGFFAERLSKVISQSLSRVYGYRFFGISIMHGHHSAMVVVKYTTAHEPTFNVYDQYGSAIDRFIIRERQKVEAWYFGSKIDEWLLDYVKGGNVIHKNNKTIIGFTTTIVTPIKHKRSY